MYDCVTGVQIPENYGCIMADEMVILNETNRAKNFFYILGSWKNFTMHHSHLDFISKISY